MSLFSWNCERCGELLDNRTAFHHCMIGDAIHDRLTSAMLVHGAGTQVDAALAECPDAECHDCGRIVCPHGEPMHFHHDGCPACSVPTVNAEGTSASSEPDHPETAP